MKNNNPNDVVSKVCDVISLACTILHIPFVFHIIHKRGTVTKTDAISLLLDGVAVGYTLHKLECYLDIKLDELKKEMGEK